MNKIFIIILCVIIIILFLILLDKLSSTYIKEKFESTTQTQNNTCNNESIYLKNLRQDINKIINDEEITNKSNIMNSCIKIIDKNFTNLQGCSNDYKFQICKDAIIDNFELDSNITTLQVANIGEQDIENTVNKYLTTQTGVINSLVNDNSITGLNKASELDKVITKYNSLNTNLINQIQSINLYKDRNNNAITKILNNESKKIDLNIKRDIIDNKKKQIENLINLINKSDDNDRSTKKIKNKSNEYIILDTKVVLRYYDITDNRLLSLEEVEKYKADGKEPNVRQYYNKNDYYKLLMNDKILLYEFLNKNTNKPCLENGKNNNVNCPDWPNNKCNDNNPSHNCWYRGLTNGTYNDNINKFNEQIQEIKEDETQNNQFSTMEYMPELYKQGGYFNLVKLTSAIYKTIFGEEKNTEDSESYIIVPAGEELTNITKILGTNRNSDLIIIDIVPNSILPDEDNNYYIWDKIL